MEIDNNYRDIINLLNERKAMYEYKKRTKSISIFFRYVRNVLIKYKKEYRQKLFATMINFLKAKYIVCSFSEFHGIFELDVHSTLTQMVLNKDFEKDIIPFFEIMLSPGKHVIDIGANMGLYTVLAAKLVGNNGRVLAVEPTPSVFKLLSSNIRRNELENVVLFNGVIASQRNTYLLNMVEGSPEYSSLGSIVHPHAPKEINKIMVHGETLDNLVTINGLNPFFIKIDVEGAEGLVLSGADLVLSNNRPIILSELDERLLKELNWDSQMVISLLANYQYKIFDAHNGIEINTSTIKYPFIGEIICLPAETYV